VRRALAQSALAALALAAAACGYSTGSLAPQGRRTIAVPVFENPTRRHDLEWELTRAVVEEIHSRTNLLVVDPNDSPDLVLKGALVEVDEDVLSHADDQRIRESAYFLTAEVEVLDGRTGATVVKKGRVTERESFVPALGEDVRTAREEAGRALAERIVQRLEAAW
jgi:outer membrane lipopolysaccharide assembly protein LptE/RlpB